MSLNARKHKRRRVDKTNNTHTDITAELRRYAILEALDRDFLSTVTIGYVFNKGYTALLVTSSDDVYGVSRSRPNHLSYSNVTSDDSGEDEETADDIESPVLKRIEGLSKKNVVDFASNFGQVVALTKEGRVFVCEIKYCVGLREDDSSGNDEYYSDDEVERIPVRRWITLEGINRKMIIQAVFVDGMLLLFTKEGELLKCSGGIPSIKSYWFNGESFKQGKKQDVTTKIVRIVYGDSHLLALSSDGALYKQRIIHFGRRVSFSKPASDADEPIRLQPKDDPQVQFASMAAYKNLVAVQTVTGKVYVWGDRFGDFFNELKETYISRFNNVFPIIAKMIITPKPIKSENKDRLYSVKHSIAGLFDDIEDSDVTFRVGGKTIHAHKFILFLQCEHFKVMFNSEWKESTTGVIEITNFTYDVYRAFLYYLYTDELDITYEDAVEMLDLAQSYGATDLKLRCERVIAWWIRDNNVAEIYQFAVKYECSTLQEACVEHSKFNMEDIVISEAFREIDAEIARDFVVKALS